MKNRTANHPLATAITFALTAIGGVVATMPNTASAAAVLVDSVGVLNPNPSGLATVEIGNTSLSAAKLLVAAAYGAGTGGVIDFQQQYQGGTFPNATSAINGIDVATDSANPLNVTLSSSGGAGSLVATGPVVFSFYRSDAITAGSVVTNDNIDSNNNQGANIISGGYKSRDPIAAGTAVTGTVNFTSPPPVPDGVGGTTGTSGGYMGITGAASPATFVFDTTPLSFFGITALPRGSSRNTLITLLERPNAGGADIFVPIGVATLVTTSAVFFGQEADLGYTIIGAAITNPGGGGQNRYDDFAFIAAVPEPSAVVLGGLGMLALLRRRRA